MRLIDEYRDPQLAERLRVRIERLAQAIGRTVTIMEFCGSHTYAIARFGIKKMLPESVRLISGPGCPVCVTAASDVETALHLASQDGVIFTTFGDMLRVPGQDGRTMQGLRAQGADVRVVGSALDVMKIARDHPDRDVVFMGIGFETTAPTVASMIMSCRDKGMDNVSVFSVHKVIPPAVDILLDDPGLSIDGFICPGHVSTVIGYVGYARIPERKRAAVITGFEPVDILEGISMILGQISLNSYSVENQYVRAVRPEGNARALDVMNKAFKRVPAEWRGLGVIPESGLALRPEFASFDALERFDVPRLDAGAPDDRGCMCGSVLRGIVQPDDCPLYRSACTPSTPMGPCMVSREGTCAAYYKCR